jgi:uncharacterized protein YqeY
MIKERLSEDLKSAMKQGNSDLVGTLRFLLSQIQNEEIKNRGTGGDGTLSDEAVITVLKGELKRRNESIEMFRDGKREDLVAQEEKAVSIIKKYVPAELSREEVIKVVSKLKESGLGDFNTLMKSAMAELKGKADGKVVSEVVKEALNG